MTEILHLLFAAAPERAALLFGALVVFALVYVLRENRAQRLELEENHSLHVRLLECLLKEKTDGQKNHGLVDVAGDRTADCVENAAVQPQPGPALASDNAGGAAGGNYLPLKSYVPPRVRPAGSMLSRLSDCEAGT